MVDHPFYDWLRLNWDAHHARTILYAVTVDFYRAHIYGRYREIPGRFVDAEALMFDVWRQTRGDAGVYGRFRREPHLSGFAGHSGQDGLLSVRNYDGFVSRVKRGVRQLGRWVLPGLKL